MDKQELLAIGNNRLRRLATVASIAVSSTLIAAKLAAWIMTGSVAMLSSLFDSCFDLIASLITAFGVASALRPPDREHRYGHGKAEPLAALAQAVIIIGSSIVLANEAIDRFFHPAALTHEAMGYAVMALAIVLTIGLVSFQHRVVRKTGSHAVHADRLHYVGDLAINLAVVAAFVLQHFTGMPWFDPAFGVAIASGLLVSAYHIIRNAMTTLMDAELPEDEREKIRTIVMKQPGVIGLHDMRTRSDSDRIFIELHVEMDPDMSLRAAHDLSERILDVLYAAIPQADIVIHQDPAGIEEDRRDMRIEA